MTVDEVKRCTENPTVQCRKDLRSACAEAARGELSKVDRDILLTDRTACLSVSTGLTAGAADIATDLVQTVAQVVVTKAQQSGWDFLRDNLRKAARCDVTGGQKFVATCRLLENLHIKDLVSSPNTLLSVVVSDLLAHAKTSNTAVNALLTKEAPLIGATVGMVDPTWLKKGGAVNSGLKRLVDALVTSNASVTCDATTTKPLQQYAVVAGLCMLESANDLSKCRVSAQFEACPGIDKTTAGRLWDATVVAARSKSATDWIDLVFMIGEEEVEEVPNEKWTSSVTKESTKSYLGNLHDVLAGVASNNWVLATSGGVSLMNAIAESLPEQERPSGREAAKLIGLMATVGNYALTYDPAQKLDATEAAAAREKVMVELVDRMVNRSDREGGAIVSLGGNLGLVGGLRLGSGESGSTKSAWAFPVQLGLGVGLQTYGKKTDWPGGFHAQFSVIDLGQYVNFDGQDLKVATPQLQTSVLLSITVGGWFALRQTPVYAGVNGAVAPFNQAAGKPTYQIGAVVGMYVPLLDFN